MVIVSYILRKEIDMDTWHKIVDMTKTPLQRESLNALSDTDKLRLILELTDSKSFIDALEYIQQAEEDRKYCQSYR